MKFFKTLTQFLFVVLVGYIIGALIRNDMPAFGWCALFLLIDILVGCVLQSLINADATDSGRGEQKFTDSFDEGAVLMKKQLDEMRAKGIDVDVRCDDFCKKYGLGKYATCYGDEPNLVQDELSKKFLAVYLRLKSNGARLISNYMSDEAGELLLDVCRQMPHAPLRSSFLNIDLIVCEDLDGAPAIVYSFKYSPRTIAHNAVLFLVHTQSGKIRLFTVETSNPFALCEYSGNRHINYGQLELKDTLIKIKRILNT